MYTGVTFMIINLSNKNKYFSQRDNFLRPSGTCGPTSAANAIHICNIDIPEYNKHPEKQLEDIITATLQTEEARKYMLSKYPAASFNPWNVSDCIVWAVNKLAGKKVAECNRLSEHEMFYTLLKNEGVIVVGTSLTPSRHFVTVVGFDTEQSDIESVTDPQDIDTNFISKIIIDDSWGNVMTDYKDRNGYNVSIPYSVFVKHILEYSKEKMCQKYFMQ